MPSQTNFVVLDLQVLQDDMPQQMQHIRPIRIQGTACNLHSTNKLVLQVAAVKVLIICSTMSSDLAGLLIHAATGENEQQSTCS